MTVAEWIDRYYRPERLHREPDTRERIVAHREQDLREHGATLISRHDSVTGHAEWIYADGYQDQGDRYARQGAETRLAGDTHQRRT